MSLKDLWNEIWESEEVFSQIVTVLLVSAGVLLVFFIVVVVAGYIIKWSREFDLSQQIDAEVRGYFNDSGSGEQVCLTFNNTSDSTVKAIRVLVFPHNVYGEEITDFNNQKQFNTTIYPNETKMLMCDVSNLMVSEADVYIYSVYYEDGREWGNRKANERLILKKSPVLHLSK